MTTEVSHSSDPLAEQGALFDIDTSPLSRTPEQTAEFTAAIGRAAAERAKQAPKDDSNKTFDVFDQMGQTGPDQTGLFPAVVNRVKATREIPLKSVRLAKRRRTYTRPGPDPADDKMLEMGGYSVGQDSQLAKPLSLAERQAVLDGEGHRRAMVAVHVIGVLGDLDKAKGNTAYQLALQRARQEKSKNNKDV